MFKFKLCNIVFLCFKAEAVKKFKEEDCPKFLDNLEKLLNNNQEGKGWFVGDKVRIHT